VTPFGEDLWNLPELAALRRYGQQPDRLNIKRDDAYILSSLGFVAPTGLALEVMRLRSQQPPWVHWSWLGNALAGLFGPPPEQPPAIYPFVWWAHQLTTFALIATLPYTKFLHILTAPTNIFPRRLDPPGRTPKIEEIETTAEPRPWIRRWRLWPAPSASSCCKSRPRRGPAAGYRRCGTSPRSLPRTCRPAADVQPQGLHCILTAYGVRF
jgi:hypothetical protein